MISVGFCTACRTSSCLRKYFFTLLNASSIGLRSGLYGGKNRNAMPADLLLLTYDGQSSCP